MYARSTPLSLAAQGEPADVRITDEDQEPREVTGITERYFSRGLSPLATARIIEDLGSVPYPEGINGPHVELNLNASAGKFKYDRDFLLQFMQVCKEKPDNLPPLDAIGLEPSEQTSYNITRGGSGRRTTSSMSGGPSAVAARQASIGLGFIPGSMSKSGSSGFAMGNISTAAGVGKMSSEDRFAMANG
ncbi:hypothetical protein EVG20_g11226, partial [Dentipellis fragilis]